MTLLHVPVPVAAAAYVAEPVFRLTVDQYHTMIDRGILTPDDRVELIEGILVYRMSKNPPHVFCNEQVARALLALLPAGHFLFRQDPITLEDSEPEPDIAVICGDTNDFRGRHPNASEVQMVVEIAESSLLIDRGIKRRAYARAGIACYWIVNLNDRVIEVHTDPDATGPAYCTQQVYAIDTKVAVVIAGQTVGEIAVADVLP
ncbi:MAG TPA: Uma2 family endonuclease [Tepidisphaeraceae bacterium]|jgi:Uma2 family endonuclease